MRELADLTIEQWIAKERRELDRLCGPDQATLPIDELLLDIDLLLRTTGEAEEYRENGRKYLVVSNRVYHWAVEAIATDRAISKGHVIEVEGGQIEVLPEFVALEKQRLEASLDGVKAHHLWGRLRSLLTEAALHTLKTRLEELRPREPP
jgi:hypothetical protein